MRFHRPALSITVSIPIFRTTLLCLLAGILSARAVEPAFIYQGHLQESGGPTTGAYDLRFELYDSLEGGTLVAGPLTNTAAPVSNGLFTTSLDFGVETFNGADRWLAIAVRTNGVGTPFEPLWPRQRVSPAPYALRAMRVQASGVDGTLGVSQLPVAAVTNGAAGVTLSGTFIGSGAGLSGVNAAAVGGTGLPGLWQLGGNSVGINQFLGSTNEHPLDLRAGGRRVLRLESEPDWGTVRITGGFAANSASGYGATVSGGGATNYLFTPRSWANVGSGDFSAIAGGAGNQVSGNWGSIGGGRENVAAGDYSSVGGGNANSASASFGVVGGGASNTNLASYGTISGGALNTVTGLEAAVGGGINNIASARNATVSGGAGNIANGPGAIVGGGGYNGSVWRGNVASGAAATISGGLENKATAEGAFVGGGSYNSSGFQSVVGGGFMNVSTGSFAYATVSGGRENNAGGVFSAVGGGYANTNTGYGASISGGYQNRASGDSAAVGGGIANAGTGLRSTVSGGALNLASGSYSSIPGGNNNVAGGAYSLAAGQNAMATNDGAFVWSDTQYGPFPSTSSNQFLIRSAGGVGINTNNPQATLHVNGNTRIEGLMRLGSERGTSNSFLLPGLIYQRIESLNQAAGQILARTDVLTLERDGTTSGLLVRFPVFPGKQVINALGITSTGALVPFRTVLNDPASSGVVQICTAAQRLVHLQISFGNVYNNNGRLTQVTLDRTDDGAGINDFYWIGTLISNFNQ